MIAIPGMRKLCVLVLMACVAVDTHAQEAAAPALDEELNGMEISTAAQKQFDAINAALARLDEECATKLRDNMFSNLDLAANNVEPECVQDFNKFAAEEFKRVDFTAEEMKELQQEAKKHQNTDNFSEAQKKHMEALEVALEEFEKEDAECAHAFRSGMSALATKISDDCQQKFAPFMQKALKEKGFTDEDMKEFQKDQQKMKRKAEREQRRAKSEKKSKKGKKSKKSKKKRESANPPKYDRDASTKIVVGFVVAAVVGMVGAWFVLNGKMKDSGAYNAKPKKLSKKKLEKQRLQQQKAKQGSIN